MIIPINERSNNSKTRVLKKLRKDDRTKKWINDETIIFMGKNTSAWYFYKANDENKGKLISFFPLYECCPMNKKFKLIDDKNGIDTYYEPDFTEELKNILKRMEK